MLCLKLINDFFSLRIEKLGRSVYFNVQLYSKKSHEIVSFFTQTYLQRLGPIAYQLGFLQAGSNHRKGRSNIANNPACYVWRTVNTRVEKQVNPGLSTYFFSSLNYIDSKLARSMCVMDTKDLLGDIFLKGSYTRNKDKPATDRSY